MQLQLASMQIDAMRPLTAEAAIVTQEDYKIYAEKKAIDNGLDPVQVKKVINCESGWNPEATGKLGERGLVQIWLKQHPYVTEAQAVDPFFAIDFLTKNLKAHKTWWSCWKIHYGTSDP